MAFIHYKNKFIPVDDCLIYAVKIKCNYFKSVAALIDSWNKGEKNFVIMTSGSTGKPKAVSFSRDQCIKSAQQTIDIFALKKDDNFLCCLDISYVAGFMMIIRALVAEANIYLTKAERNPFLKTDLKAKFSFAAFVPYQLQSILEDNISNISHLDQMKAIIIGGGSISSKYFESINHIHAPVFHTYAMTETLTHVALKRINGDHPDKYFKAIPGVFFSQDDRSCLIISTAVIPNKIGTNDVVELKSETEFDYLGRIDNVINSGGFKIHPDVVEQKISSVIDKYFGTDNFFIFAMADDKFGEQPELIIETDKNKNCLPNMLSDIKKILHPYEVPKNVHLIPSFEFTRTGKVDRQKTKSRIMDL